MTSGNVSPQLEANWSEELDSRRYWTNQLEAASQFMENAVRAPLNEKSEPAEDLAAVLPAGLDVLYASGPESANKAGKFFLRERLVPQLTAVVRDFNRMGLALRIEFGYRTPETQAQLCSSAEVMGRVISSTVWETRGERPSPELVYRRLIVLCANIYKNGTHLGASALDVSLVDRETGGIFDLGAPYLTLTEVTPMESPSIGPIACRNRALLRQTFARHGFVAYPFEFWHFSAGDVFESLLSDTGSIAEYGPVLLDARTGKVTPVPDPEAELVPRPVMLKRIRDMLDDRFGDE